MDVHRRVGDEVKYETLKANEALAKLASIERSEPGRLASWLRARPPLREPTNNVYFISVVPLNQERK